MARDWQQYN